MQAYCQAILDDDPEVALITLSWLHHVRSQRRERLAPSERTSWAIVEALNLYGIIVKTAQRLPWVDSVENLSGTCSVEEVLSPAMGDCENLMQRCEELLKRAVETEATHADIVATWRWLIASECDAFIRAEFEDHRLDPQWGAGAYAELELGAEVLSAAQMLDVCWHVVRDVGRAYFEHDVPGWDMNLYLRDSLKGTLAEAARGPRVPPDFDRHPRGPESVLTRVFKAITGLGPRYFYAVPSAASLRTAACHSPSETPGTGGR